MYMHIQHSAHTTREIHLGAMHARLLIPHTIHTLCDVYMYVLKIMYVYIHDSAHLTREIPFGTNTHFMLYIHMYYELCMYTCNKVHIWLERYPWTTIHTSCYMYTIDSNSFFFLPKHGLIFWQQYTHHVICIL